MLASACSNDSSSPDPIVGSGDVVSRTTEAMFVERVSVSVPFRATIANGEPNKIVLRGEDNLLDEITVEETDPGVWSIAANQKLAFEQHDDVQVEIPYIEMVELQIKGDRTVLKDHPTEVWRDGGTDAGTADAGQ